MKYLVVLVFWVIGAKKILYLLTPEDKERDLDRLVNIYRRLKQFFKNGSK